MQIELSEHLVKLLHKHATPFVDTTPLSVVEKWADFFERHHSKEVLKSTVPDRSTEQVVSGRTLDPNRPPSLLHTRVRGSFAGIPFSTWNEMLRIAHLRAFKKVGSFEELRAITRAKIRKGIYTNEGYKPIPEIGISLQGVDAGHAWEYALRIAMYLKMPVRAEVEWRHKDGAAYPGERGILQWNS